MPMAVRYTTVDGQVLCENRGGVKTLFMPDTLGNVIETRNMDTGAQTSSTTYWPYGEVRTQTGTNPSPFGFCGVWGYYTQAGQPTYVRARYYRPNLGRWQTVDPLWPWQMPYRFASNPLTSVDASGLAAIYPGSAFERAWGLRYGSDPDSLIPDIPGQVKDRAKEFAMECMYRVPCINAVRKVRQAVDPGSLKLVGDMGLDHRSGEGNAIVHCISACEAVRRLGFEEAWCGLSNYERLDFGGSKMDNNNNRIGANGAGRSGPHCASFPGPTCTDWCLCQWEKSKGTGGKGPLIW
ncbi:MAG TPA: RHS repeat-associated core domain-containing protein [Fimbriimonadaceae bacterium]|nr:RHS repeat-associated core domain-containing protein [Fimbriimonadaceae bacterium]HRE93725.1 RHS repeat-associated core domain-containing protein [Fimbriimonadaceae bacterium]HRI74587.1 RHS repeat-associated core domain-containing protein [Fimbriimonadaceae bacterium]